MLYGSDTWFLRKNEFAILKRTEKALIRAMCGVTSIEKRSSKKFMKLLGLEETLERQAKANVIQ